MHTQPCVLAAVDLDHQALEVIAQAGRLAALCQGHLVVVHVVDDTGAEAPDKPFPERRGDLRQAMARHARASLVGMISHLDLPNAWVEVRVEFGAVAPTLAKIAADLQPRYCLVGPSRLGPLSPSAGLAAAIKGRSDCELLRLSGRRGGNHSGLISRVSHWLAGDLIGRKGQTGQGQQGVDRRTVCC
jgi:hypothetical protein